MCDYSQHGVANRPAVVDETLVVRMFGGGTRGLASPTIHSTAVCLRPGTEMKVVSGKINAHPNAAIKSIETDTVIFRQVNTDNKHVHHDVFETPDGRQMFVHHLLEGQAFKVLQVPVDAGERMPYDPGRITSVTTATGGSGVVHRAVRRFASILD